MQPQGEISNKYQTNDPPRRSLLRRIRLRNFMSHVDTELELADGVNVIVGPNNCGKSAIVSALSVLATNASGDYMVRHSCDSCSVTSLLPKVMKSSGGG